MRLIGLWLWRLVPGNPMVARIVESGSRRAPHMYVRMAYLGLLVSLVLLGLLSGGGLEAAVDLGDLAIAGSQVFRIVAYGQVIGVCLLAPLFMSGAIASEQSGKTYNILLTTPLSNVQIVLGSLLGRLFFVLALLLSGLPLFAVVLVFGGVRVSSVFVAFAVAGCTAVLVGSVAVLLSVLRAAGRKAVFVFVIAVAAYLAGIYGLDRGLLRLLDPEPTTTWLTALHPLLVLESSLLADYRPPPPEALAGASALGAWWYGSPLQAFAAWTLGVSLAIVLSCAVFLRRIGQGESRVAAAVFKALRVRAGERTRPARQVTGNPIAWREAKTRGRLMGGVLGRYGFALVGWGLSAALVWAYHTGSLPRLPAGPSAGGVAANATVTDHDLFRGALTALILLEVAVVSLVAIYMSAGCVSREREDGTLDIMLTTPVTPRQYIWGKLRGLVQFLALMLAVPVVTLLGVSVYVLVGAARGWPQAVFTYQTTTTTYGQSVAVSIPNLPLVLPEAGLWLALMLVPFVALCVAIGMLRSLRAKGVLGAVSWSMGIVLVVIVFPTICSFSALGGTPLVGPVLNALSPAANVGLLLDPWSRLEGFAGDGQFFGRISLGVGALVAAGVYSAAVYSLILSMVKSFDQTVRKLSGTG